MSNLKNDVYKHINKPIDEGKIRFEGLIPGLIKYIFNWRDVAD
jgi:hypothetical protein